MSSLGGSAGTDRRVRWGWLVGRHAVELPPSLPPPVGLPPMDPPPPSQDSPTQPGAPSPLAPYRWHTGGAREKGSAGSRWGLLAGWGRALSHPEPPVSSQPARRSLFRRVLSAPPKVSGTSRLRLSRTLWGRPKNPSPGPEAEPEPPEAELEPQPEPPVSQIPEAPSPDVAVWDIGGFTLLDGRLMLLGGEDESPWRRPRAGSGSSEGSTQAFLGKLREPDRTLGKPSLEASGSNHVHNVRGLLKRIKEKKKSKLELGANALRDGPPSTLGSKESLSMLSELDLGAERDVRVRPLHPSLLGEPYCFQVTWVGGSRCFSCRSGAERDRWVEDLRRQFQPSQDNAEREETWLSVWVHEAKGLPRAATGALVQDLGTGELERCGGREALLFRENTLATKAIDEYMKLVAHDYLQETLGRVVRCLCASTEDCEVDPSKCPASELPEHQARLQKSCEEVFGIIVHSYNWFPAELSAVFSGWREACKARGSDTLGPRLVCASLFLRLLCPAILAPSLFGLTAEHPAPGPARTLTLIAKVIQNLANRAPFGEKEAYMDFMNSFLEDHGPAMQRFLDQVAVVDVDAAPSGYQASGDLALQLAVLHAQLCTIFAELDQTTCDNLEPLPTILRAIQEGRPVPVSVPMHLPPPHTQAQCSFSAGEKPGFLAPRDLPKHTPLISKSQSLRSFQGAGSLARPPPRPSVPWQRQLDQPRDRDQALGPPRPVGKLAELQGEVAALREEQKALSRQVESLSSELGALAQQQEQLCRQLQDLDSRLRAGTSKLDLKDNGLPSHEDHRPPSLHDRLAEMERTQAQLRDVIQNLQLVWRTAGFQGQPLPLQAPCVNGDST
ncbi:PREDICTED: RAS protein activator like-3 [Dipodomys ordii]|uniref:RAS protein activator like-3 n=1 Tax=Dipodomys ordii TaxID=10020 RepID=A0A1S3G4Y9_DIPOR|nr:PREDICTED: RAS protein activator like-3 [Dipodomys ordii]